MECCNNYINISLAKEGTCGWGQMRAKYNDTYYDDAMMKYITLYINLLFFSLAEEEQTLWKLLAYKTECSITNG